MKPSLSECCSWCDQPVPSDQIDKVRAVIAEKERKLQSKMREEIARELAPALTKLKNELAAQKRQLEEPRRIGRPTKPPAPNERVPVALRVTPEIKIRLDTAASQGGRSLSQEAEIRLERSFEREDLLSEALTLAYGRKAAGVLMAIAYVMDAAPRLTERNTWNPFRKDWTDDPELFDHAVQAATALLYAVRPPGEIPDRSSEPSSDRREPGTWLVSELLLALRDDNSEFPADVTTDIKQMLGPLARRMTENARAAVGDRSGSPKLRLPISDTGEWALKNARISRRRLRK